MKQGDLQNYAGQSYVDGMQNSLPPMEGKPNNISIHGWIEYNFEKWKWYKDNYQPPPNMQNAYQPGSRT